MDSLTLINTYLLLAETPQELNREQNIKYTEEIMDLCQNLPRNLPEELLVKLYQTLLREHGLFPNLKFCGKAHYPLLLQAFTHLIPLLSNNNKSSELELFFLFDCQDLTKWDKKTSKNLTQEIFNARLDVILKSKTFQTMGKLLKKINTLEGFSAVEPIYDSAWNTLRHQPYEEQGPMSVGDNLLLYWSLVAIILWADEEKILALVKQKHIIAKKLFLDNLTKLKDSQKI